MEAGEESSGNVVEDVSLFDQQLDCKMFINSSQGRMSWAGDEGRKTDYKSQKRPENTQGRFQDGNAASKS